MVRSTNDSNIPDPDDLKGNSSLNLNSTIITTTHVKRLMANSLTLLRLTLLP